MPITEISSDLKVSGQVTLDAQGNGVLTFDPDNARQRWEATSVVVTTDQDANATTIPVVTLALNAVTLQTSSPGNSRGSTWSGNQDTFTGLTRVGPCDFLSVLFSPPPGQDPTELAGVVATAIVTGIKFTRRS
jgi:hypothetical protein